MEKHPNAPGLANVPAGTPTSTPDGRSFIGSKSKEFGGSRPVPKTIVAPAVGAIPDEAKPEPEEPDKELSTCSRCSFAVPDGAVFCPACGMELDRHGLAKALGITLDEKDLSDYLFQGYLVKEVPLVHGKMALFKTLLPSESEKIEQMMMERFGNDQVTNKLWVNAYSIITLSYGWVKFDDTGFGDTPEKRFEHIQERTGAHLVDLASLKWNQFNRAVGAMLEDPEAIKN